MDKKATVLIISFTDHRTDPRLHRQIVSLANKYNLITAGVSPHANIKTIHIELHKKEITLIEKTKIAITLKAKRYEAYYWSQYVVQDALKKLANLSYNIVISNDTETLPLALKLAKAQGAKVLVDAHEYDPRVFDSEFVFNFFLADYNDYLCKTYLHQADYMTTVCNSIADEYSKNYNVNCDVLMNMPAFIDLKPTDVDNTNIKIIHHGGLKKSRRIENMIRLVGKYLDSRFHLDLMLVNNNPAYFRRLREIAATFPNIHFIEPVEMPKIAEVINQYDLGLYMLPPASFNNNLSLPNKFFEFVQARLAIAIWPSPEMKKITLENKLGIVADNFSIDSMAEKLNRLSVNDIKQYKENSGKAALRYNSEKSGNQLLKIIGQLVN